MIDYKKIYASENFYKSRGYKRIESPWIVSIGTIQKTINNEQNPFLLYGEAKGLVGSAEQSLLELQEQGLLPNGKIQSITPCFRDEEEDFLHHKWFIKNELMVSYVEREPTEKDLEEVLEDAKCFFDRYLWKTEIVKTDIGYDIEYKKIELGSYGFRESNGFKWIYGTGCAEPRLSNAMMMLK